MRLGAAPASTRVYRGRERPAAWATPSCETPSSWRRARSSSPRAWSWLIPRRLPRWASLSIEATSQAFHRALHRCLCASAESGAPEIRHAPSQERQLTLDVGELRAASHLEHDRLVRSSNHCDGIGPSCLSKASRFACFTGCFATAVRPENRSDRFRSLNTNADPESVRVVAHANLPPGNGAPTARHPYKRPGNVKGIEASAGARRDPCAIPARSHRVPAAIVTAIAWRDAAPRWIAAILPAFALGLRRAWVARSIGGTWPPPALYRHLFPEPPFRESAAGS